MCAHSGRAVGAPKCLSQSSAATSGISRAPCAGAAGGFPFYPSGKQALVLRSPACAGALLHAAHSDLADYCREGLNSARAPHALPFSLQLQYSSRTAHVCFEKNALNILFFFFFGVCSDIYNFRDRRILNKSVIQRGLFGKLKTFFFFL